MRFFHKNQTKNTRKYVNINFVPTIQMRKIPTKYYYINF